MTDEQARGLGTLIIIGGHEDRDPKGDKVILREFVRRAGPGKIVLATVASHQPEGYFDEYQAAFAELGVAELVELYVEERSQALAGEQFDLLDGAAGIFFTGGDQLRITSQIGDTRIEEKVKRFFEQGGVVAGTSAGASVMSETMLVKGSSAETHRIGDLHMAPGMGLVRDVIIDQHFAERGRMGRLLGAVSQNPRMLGIGIDEDTAVVLEKAVFEVIGSGGVYVVDGAGATYCNVAEARAECVLSMDDVRVHVLSSGDHFDVSSRKPSGKGDAP